MDDFEGVPHLVNIRDIIVSEVLPHQECYLHDRYAPLEPIGT